MNFQISVFPSLLCLTAACRQMMYGNVCVCKICTTIHCVNNELLLKNEKQMVLKVHPEFTDVLQLETKYLFNWTPVVFKTP